MLRSDVASIVTTVAANGGGGVCLVELFYFILFYSFHLPLNHTKKSMVD